MKKTFFAIVIILLLASYQADASGIQVSPARLTFEVGDEKVTKEIIIANPTTDVQIFKVYMDSFERGFTITPGTFTLEAGDRKVVTVEANPNRLEGSDTTLETTLSVVGSPLVSGQVPIGTGAKIKVSVIKAVSPGFHMLGLVSGGAGVVAIASLWWWLNRRR